MSVSAAGKTVAVIGGGPAGLIAAETLATAGASVTLYDRMPSLGRKFLMAGRGGLNLTHSEPLETFVRRYGTAAPVLSPLIEHFSPAGLTQWCEALGQPTFVGSSGRVFPKSMKASPLLRAWLRRLATLGVTVETRTAWRGWSANGALTFQRDTGETFDVAPNATILALGGASWPRLGADGGWVETLRAAGVDVATLVASNAGVAVAWSDHIRARFAGAPLKRIAITIDGATQRGEAIITATGLEGGAIYALSPAIRAALTRGPAAISIDLRPDLTADVLAARLARPRGKDTQTNHLRKTLALPPAAIALLRDDTRGPLPNDAAAIAARIKDVRLTVTGTGDLSRAISSAGGIALSALDDHLMLQVKPGVFAAGEMLDWDAPTGGYLLQACYATGVHAARGALNWMARCRPLAGPEDPSRDKP